MVFKLAGASAVLAGVFVVAVDVPSAQSRMPVKLLADRVPAGHAPSATVRVAAADPAPEAGPRASSEKGADCRRQAWPYVDPSCRQGDRRPVRTITIERREGDSTSNLVRIPVAGQ